MCRFKTKARLTLDPSLPSFRCHRPVRQEAVVTSSPSRPASPGPQLPTPLPKTPGGQSPPLGKSHRNVSVASGRTPQGTQGHTGAPHWGPQLTFTPKSGDVELQMAPMLAAASMASTACTPLGK